MKTETEVSRYCCALGMTRSLLKIILFNFFKSCENIKCTELAIGNFNDIKYIAFSSVNSKRNLLSCKNTTNSTAKFVNESPAETIWIPWLAVHTVYNIVIHFPSVVVV